MALYVECVFYLLCVIYLLIFALLSRLQFRKNLAIERMIVEGCDILLDVNQGLNHHHKTSDNKLEITYK